VQTDRYHLGVKRETRTERLRILAIEAWPHRARRTEPARRTSTSRAGAASARSLTFGLVGGLKPTAPSASSHSLSMVLKKRGYLAAIAGDRQISTPAAGAVKLRAA
jgi:hypothetical protein